MEDWDGRYRRLIHAIANTEIVRAPKQYLHTFGVTNLSYYIVTEPSYQDLISGPSEPESVIRQGNVSAQRPAVVTPFYMTHLEGFGDDARSYFDSLSRQFGSNSPGILYRYKNEIGEMNIVGGNAEEVANRISNQLNNDSSNLSAVIRGIDELWDVSLLKFIYEYTAASISGNVDDLQKRRLLDPEPIVNVPKAAVVAIDDLFHQVEEGADPSILKTELDRWGLFDYYEDRFLSLFRGKRN